MKTITIRIEDAVLTKIDEQRGSATRSDYIRNLLSSSLEYRENASNTKENTNEIKEHTNVIGENTDVFDKNTQNDTSERLIGTLQEEVNYLRSKLDDIIKLIHQEQSLHLQTQRQLKSPEKGIALKSWWQFWKK
ncbi:Uncharacterised protein [uncultured archaeon]|nr:Uncharacterised protein [uncultured archaeon]